MLIIFGLRVLNRILDTGTFHCPKCAVDRAYERRQGHRWGHIFWIPLLPLGDVGDPFVRCTGCRTDYLMDVLNQLTNAQFQERLSYGTRALLASLAKASMDPLAAAAAATFLLQQSVSDHYTHEALEQDQRNLDAAQAEASLRGIAEALTDAGKETVLRQGLLVAYAGGVVTSTQGEILAGIAMAVGLSQAALRGLNQEVADLVGPARA